MTVHIRPADHSDRDFLADGNEAMAIETEGRAPDRTRLLAGVAGALADPAKGRFFIAERDGERVGQLLVQREWSDWRNGWFWWLASVYVVPAHRASGVYRALYAYIRAQAKADPEVCGIRLYVEDHNERAQTVYARLGMRDGQYRVYEEDFRPLEPLTP
jgi:GNAT superfamily N-acetyltransferase